MSQEGAVRRHYGRAGLTTQLLEALRAHGADPDRLAPEDLIGFEDMHVGGREATKSLAEMMPLQPGMELLDIGAGLGGAARYFALAAGCRVTGVDLTAELVETARELSRRVGMGDRVRFETASALDLPFDEHSFDGAYSIHVGMNIADKSRFYAEAFRVVRSGGFFALYDLLRDRGEPDYPVPWAESPQTSFLVELPTLEELLRDAGFEIAAVRDRTAFATAFMSASRERTGDPQAARTSSAAIVMGPNFHDKIANLAAALEDGRLRAFELLCRRPGTPVRNPTDDARGRS